MTTMPLTPRDRSRATQARLTGTVGVSTAAGWCASAYRKELPRPLLDRLTRDIVTGFITEAPTFDPESSIADDEFDIVCEFFADQRTATIFAAAKFGFAKDQFALAAESQRQATIADLMIEGVLLDLATTFDAGGINWRLVKGLATSRVLYESSSQRSTGDVDVIVHPDQYHEALDLLRATGRIASQHPQQGPVTAHHYRCETLVHDSGVELDVHRYIDGTIMRYRIPTAVMFENPQTVTISGRQFLAPSTPALILHAMLHLSTGKTGPNSLARLSTLVDLLRARVKFPDDYAEALKIADGCGCATPARWADLVTRDWLGEPPLPSRHVPTTVKAYDRLLRIPGAISVVERCVGPQRLRRAWEAAFPGPEYRAIHGRSGIGQLRYIVTEMRPRSRR